MSFGIYLVGYIILIAGLAIGANLLHVPVQWIGVGTLCLVGVAIVHGVTATDKRMHSLRVNDAPSKLRDRSQSHVCCRFLLARWQFEPNSGGPRF
jgi:hypothetical protein